MPFESNSHCTRSVAFSNCVDLLSTQGISRISPVCTVTVIVRQSSCQGWSVKRTAWSLRWRLCAVPPLRPERVISLHVEPCFERGAAAVFASATPARRGTSPPRLYPQEGRRADKEAGAESLGLAAEIAVYVTGSQLEYVAQPLGTVVPRHEGLGFR